MVSAKILQLPDDLAAAIAVCAGEYGNGEERKKQLKEDGYDPEKVQSIVNKIYKALEPFL